MYNVLLVDDESMVRIGVKTCVDWASLKVDQVYEASNGQEALEIIKKNKVDIIITDIKMSIMDGFSMLEELKQISPKPEVIVMSCYNDYENMRQAMSYGVRDFLFKPKMYPEDIAETIKKLQGDMEEKNEGATQKIKDVMSRVSNDTYLEQFKVLGNIFEKNELEVEKAVTYVVDYLNLVMRLDDTGNPGLHIFSTILFKNLYEIRQCKKITKLLTIMKSVTERTDHEQIKEVKEELFRALQYIDLHLTDVNLSQEAVSEHIGLSVSYFCRLFKSEMGMGYSEYIVKKRIELAEKLYMTTNMKVYEIAREVGYTNERYFARLYKEQTGHSMKHMLKSDERER